MNFKIGFRYLGLLEMFSFVTVEILKPSHRSLHYDVHVIISVQRFCSLVTQTIGGQFLLYQILC